MDEQNSMDGTIRINGELKPMMPYGCHSDRAPDKFEQSVVYHGNGSSENVGWLHRMSSRCRYDLAKGDMRCNDCKHPWDESYIRSLSEYVEGLK